MNDDALGFEEDPEGFLPLTPAELNILLSLAGGEDLHGYGIMKEVERRTGGKTRLGPGTLYRAIKQMLERGWIEESEESGEGRAEPRLGDGRGRRYYRLTGPGRRIASAEVERLEELVRAAQARGIRRSPGLAPGAAPGEA